jgi:NAD(P)-dependent dehydrogenase (short-subunit alcohol dehydrogenase family)
MAREGACVVVVGRREERGRAVAKEIIDAGGEARCVRGDVTQRGDVEAMVDETVRRFGRLDCAVNNAGIVGPISTPVAHVEENEWDEVMNTNLRAVWLCMKAEVPVMLDAGTGSIVNVSSVYGYKPSPLGHGPYATTKHALVGLTKTAAIDYAAQGIRCNVVAPGFSHSEMVDPAFEAAPDFALEVLGRHSAMNRLGEGVETAAAITWLCSDRASFVNGAVLSVDGGDCTRMY